MKTETASFHTNSSCVWPNAADHEITLGWNSMPAFSVEAPEIELGWDAMPAFGTVTPAQGNAELVADFVMEARSMRPDMKANLLSSFWSAVCR